eukprot:TRINITY_DN4732_c0_g1_i3.p1 TRINITY_DN4732_c0_g1~~TRINITY_DN4732_c0_g1_i3.p1  ORF type:complete len:343 (-),score=131.61 TRINITY_DN4732_c0_g1_i3:150-1112(-)
MLKISWLACLSLAATVNGLKQVSAIRSPLAQAAVAQAQAENRQLLSCEWESLARRCSVLAEDAASGALLQQVELDAADPESDYTRWALETELCGKAQNRGRPAVQAALSRFQRMVMQLDRSDGVGSTVDPGAFAVRYVDLINTCTRTGAAAWTAAVSGLQYAGLDLEAFVPLSTDAAAAAAAAAAAPAKALDVGALAARCDARLLDFGKAALDWRAVPPCSIAQCRDMVACAAQVALRLAMLQEEWSADGPDTVRRREFGLRVSVPSIAPAPYVPHPGALELLLREDLGVAFERGVEGAATVFTVSAAEVAAWAKANSLY